MITIRNSTLNDIDAITFLLGELGYPATHDEVRLRFAQIASHPDYKTLLAVVDGKIVGMIGMLRSHSYEHNGQYIRILAMVVDREHQNKGIGKKLLAGADRWANENNAFAMVLNSGNRPERQSAYLFYQKMGFEIRSFGFIKKFKTLS